MGYSGARNLDFLEVGCYEGMSTCWFLENVLYHETCTLTCVDIAYQGPFDFNINSSGHGHKVNKLTGDSVAVLARLPHQAFDFIYVDADHDHDAVLADTAAAWPLLKPGGVIVFDDYGYDVEIMGDDPRSGIDAFFATLTEPFDVVYSGYLHAVRKPRQCQHD